MISMKIVRNTRGATAIEYGLVVGLIAVAAIGAFTFFGDRAIGMWTNISTRIAAVL